MAQQDLEWIKGELQRVEQEIQEQKVGIVAAMKAKEMPELIAFLERGWERLVQEEKDLLSALQARFTSQAGEVRAASP